MIEPQLPALLRCYVDKGEYRLRRAFEGSECAKSFDIGERIIVAGKNEVVAVVDAAAEFCVEIRAAAPTSMRGGFVQTHGATSGGRSNRRCEAGEPSANDMHQARLGLRS